MAPTVGSTVFALLDAPVKARAAAESSALIALAVLSVYIVVTSGYVRPFWTHMKLDLEQCIRETSERLVRRAEEIRICTREHAGDPVTEALVCAYPGLKAFGDARGALEAEVESANDDAVSETELIDLVFERMKAHVMSHVCRRPADGAVGANVHALHAAAAQLSAGPDVHTVLSPFHAHLADGCPKSVQKAACAIADVRLIVAETIPNLADMGRDRCGKSLIDTVKFHVGPEWEILKSKCWDAVTGAWKARLTAREQSKRAMASLMGLADRIAGIPSRGQQEHFIGFIRSIGGSLIALLKAIVPAAKFIPYLIKDIIPQILSYFRSIWVLIRSFLDAFQFIASQCVEKGMFYGLVAIARVVLGLTMKAFLTLWQIVIVEVFAWYVMFIQPAALIVFLVTIFTIVYIVKLVIALSDYATNGWTRYLGFTEEHPDAWWRVSGHEIGNRWMRNVVAWRPCFAGHVVSQSGLFCERVPSGVPSMSPSSALVRRFRIGRPIISIGARETPARNMAALERYTYLCVRKYRPNIEAHPLRSDLVRTVSACRRAVLGGGSTVDELAHYAIGDVSVQPPRDRMGALKLTRGIAVVLLCVMLAAAGVYARGAGPKIQRFVRVAAGRAPSV